MKAVSDSSLKGEGKERVAELRKHFAELVSAFSANPDPFLPPILTSNVNSKGEEKIDTTNWKEAFTQVENDLTNILGAGETPPEPAPPGSGTPINAPAPVPSSPDNTAIGTTGQVPQSPDASPATPPPVVNTPRAPTGEASAAPPATATGTAPVPTPTAPAGTINAGLLAGAIGIKNLDPEVRRQLEQVRLNVELFFAATTLNLEGEAAR